MTFKQKVMKGIKMLRDGKFVIFISCVISFLLRCQNFARSVIYRYMRRDYASIVAGYNISNLRKGKGSIIW